ncbi:MULTISPECIES: autotransporter outer membrane beta-barrel domain-containing protein [unclassified Pseudomonas]|uniref:autotransporter outer membrane beta-barrel domain-containing protein n=1 Tax=Pseudomonas sp. R1-18 TaxID=1632772 RepID=UPI003DA9E8CD
MGVEDWGDVPTIEVGHGQTLPINGSTPERSYRVIDHSTLKSEGASIGHLFLDSSTAVLTSNTVVRTGIYAQGHSDLQIADSTISNDGNGIAVLVDAGSTATIVDSQLTAPRSGLHVTGGSATLSNTTVSGGTFGKYDWGMGIFGGVGNVLAGSYVNGSVNGVSMQFTAPTSGEADTSHGRLYVNGSVIEGTEGAAIKVEAPGGKPYEADIEIANHSTLRTGNGNLLESVETTKTRFTVDNSVLSGNLVADDVSILNVILQNNAQLTGDIINSNTLAINSGAQWQMIGDHAVKSLSMDGGGVRFSEAGFHTLLLGELSGSGTFGMRVDLDQGVGDLLKVDGEANGDFGLRVRNTGVEVVSPDMQPLKIVHTEGGDAQFSLIGGRVDLGAYSYLLEQQGNDWFIVGDGRTTSPSTNTALALYNAAPSIWKSELSTLRTRMGEIRNGGTSGGWMRAYGNRLNATTGDGIDYRQQTSGLSLGADAPVDVSSGQLLFGVLGGYSKSDLDLSHGTKGEVNSYYVGAYGTWLLEDGYYLDAVLKLNRFRNKADVAMSDASKAKGDYTNTGIGGSLEFGRHIKLADDYFLEPFAQLSTVVIQGEDYRLNNGLEAKNQHTRSVLGKVGTSAGRNIPLKDGGVLQPYVRVAMAQEFSRNNDVQVNDNRFDNSLFGTRAELGAGVSVSLSERVQVHADFDYMKGKRVEQPWGANVGLRFAF